MSKLFTKMTSIHICNICDSNLSTGEHSKYCPNLGYPLKCRKCYAYMPYTLHFVVNTSRYSFLTIIDDERESSFTVIETNICKKCAETTTQEELSKILKDDEDD